jgi:hypothetical protein
VKKSKHDSGMILCSHAYSNYLILVFASSGTVS